ncbi:Protein with cacluim-binding EF-hand domain [Methanococcoides burtonii DSM 6242]|uniref:Protein with cacluim-binding EF-hand domain n=2 Tax=Methanococcoides burtonii TaxID=29291 RepID=Q12YS3_METBU|nr:Protein with cacluim-binding EF-hand domain [Methanococcoides burtonii DSM 6242]
MTYLAAFLNAFKNSSRIFISWKSISETMQFQRSFSYFLLILLFILCIGCVSDDSSTNNYDQNPDQVLSDPDVETYNVSLKKTAVLDIDNGYSLKLLEINRKENFVRLSFRKDGQEYLTSKLLTGNNYAIKDPNDEFVVYSVIVDKIYDNSFLIDLTYTTKSSISLEVPVLDIDQQKVPEVSIGIDTISRNYEWEYDSTKFSMTAEYYKDNYGIYSERSRTRDFDQFVTDTYDDTLISQLTSQVEKMAYDGGYGENDIPYITMAFVQSLPYVSDSASAGYDEYPRFPFETLYHGGGDCEDSSILLASLLYDMGYGVALIELPGHMAVGVKGEDDLSGSYYNYNGVKYYYLETTASGWGVGVIPGDYTNEEATIKPIGIGSPELSLTFTGTGEENYYGIYVDLEIVIENVGSITAEDVVIYTALESTDEGMVWDQIKSDTIPEIAPESSIVYSVSRLKVPDGESYRVGITGWGSNVNSEYIYSEWRSS